MAKRAVYEIACTDVTQACDLRRSLGAVVKQLTEELRASEFGMSKDHVLTCTSVVTAAEGIRLRMLYLQSDERVLDALHGSLQALGNVLLVQFDVIELDIRPVDYNCCESDNE